MNLICPNCNAVNKAPTNFCKNCGVAFAVQPKKQKSAASMVALLILILIPVFCCGYLFSKSEQEKREAEKVQNIKNDEVEKRYEELKAISPSDSLKRIKELNQLQSLTQEQESEFNILISNIPENAPEFKEVRKIDDARRKKYEQVKKVVDKEARKAAIEKLEKDLLSKGGDFYFTWKDKNETVLEIKYVLMSRPLVYQIQTETDFLKTLEEIGVKKVIFTDGYDDSWTFDFSK